MKSKPHKAQHYGLTDRSDVIHPRNNAEIAESMILITAFSARSAPLREDYVE